MSRLLALFFLLVMFPVAAQEEMLAATLPKIDAAIEQASLNLDKADPKLESLLKSYRDTRVLLLDIAKQQTALESFSAARENAYEEAQQVRGDLEKARSGVVASPDEAVALSELEQLIQVGKSDLAIMHERLNGIVAQRDSESGRSVGIRERLAELGSRQPDLEADLKLVSNLGDAGSLDEARYWLAQAQYQSNRREKARLDEELISQPMRLDLLLAQQDKISLDIERLGQHIAAMEQRAGELRKKEADDVRKAAKSAEADALGKHPLVKELAESNSVLSGEIVKRSEKIAGFRGDELEATTLAEQFERELKTIERKLEILGMTKTVGVILREQEDQLPGPRKTRNSLVSIAEDISASSLRQMELHEERRGLRDIDAYVELSLNEAETETTEQINSDLRELAQSRRDLVDHAIEVEATYARALSDLDFEVHRLEKAADQYRAFISERLLWVQSRDALSWSIFSNLGEQLTETFSPDRGWKALSNLELKTLGKPLVLLLIALTAGLFYFSGRLKAALLATSHSVGFVRKDSFGETLKALMYSIILMLKWPLLILIIASPLDEHPDDSRLAAALYHAATITALYFLGLEFMRSLLLPKGLVESHFRWPAKRVADLHRRVRRFEQTFLGAAFLALLFMELYKKDVGGPMGTISITVALLSIAYFFYRLPHFVQGKMDRFFMEPQARIHSFWGTLVRGLLAWAPIAMIVAVFFGYTYTAVEFTRLLLQTVVLCTTMLMVHELGMRWLRLTRRRLRLKAEEDMAQASGEDSESNVEEESLDHDSDVLDDEGTKFLNALLLLGSVLGIAVVWSDVIPALGILNSIELWQRTDSINGKDLVIQITLADVFGALAIGLLGWVLVRRIPSLIEILLKQRTDIGAASAYAVGTVVKYTLTTIVVITVLSMLGGSWSQIQWAVAALSLGIGFGLQEIVANFFSGLIILFEQPIRVGDTVTVGETSGVVTKIQMRATTIRDWDRRELLVPNKEFVTGRLLNWSLSDPVTRIVIEVGVAYGTDMDRALEIVRQAAVKHPLILDDPGPFVTFDEFGDNSLTIVLRCYLEELDSRLSTASALRLDIYRNLEAAEISVAFPQRDVHLDASEPLDIRLVGQAPEA